MHELSIAESLIEIVKTEMANRHISRVEAIHLRIGEMTDVVPEALAFGYEVLTKDTPLESCRLVIDRIPVVAHCKVCERQFTVAEYLFVCPGCSSSDVTVVTGMELDIASLEIAEEQSEGHRI